jgi:uncharacterized membrane protein YecN with MAPEG domain
MLIITALFAGVLSLIFIKVSFKVNQLQKLHQTSFGPGNVDELDRTIQAQANFVEYVPLCLLLMSTLEINGAPLTLVALLGCTVVLGRYLNAKGMQFTFFALAILALSNIIWVGYLIVASVQFAAAH